MPNRETIIKNKEALQNMLSLGVSPAEVYTCIIGGQPPTQQDLDTMMTLLPTNANGAADHDDEHNTRKEIDDALIISRKQYKDRLAVIFDTKLAEILTSLYSNSDINHTLNDFFDEITQHKPTNNEIFLSILIDFCDSLFQSAQLATYKAKHNRMTYLIFHALQVICEQLGQHNGCEDKINQFFENYYTQLLVGKERNYTAERDVAEEQQRSDLLLFFLGLNPKPSLLNDILSYFFNPDHITSELIFQDFLSRFRFKYNRMSQFLIDFMFRHSDNLPMVERLKSLQDIIINSISSVDTLSMWVDLTIQLMMNANMQPNLDRWLCRLLSRYAIPTQIPKKLTHGLFALPDTSYRKDSPLKKMIQMIIYMQLIQFLSYKKEMGGYALTNIGTFLFGPRFLHKVLLNRDDLPIGNRKQQFTEEKPSTLSP